MDKPLIRLRGLTKIFHRDAARIAAGIASDTSGERAHLLATHRHEIALDDVDLDVARGSIQVVMGLSGSGKSTLIRHVNRLIEPTLGSVAIDGEDVLALKGSALRRFRRERIAMVFQRFALLPHRTVAQNVAYGVRSAGASLQQQEEVAAQWIERVGLSGAENLYPAQLSGGMQQRVGLARALATQADILLMDEAFSALDPLIRRDMQDLLLELQRDLHRTILFVTHDLDEALRLGDRIAILRDGRIVQEGTRQEIVLSPANDYVAAFVGQVDPGRVVDIGSLVSGEEPSAANEPRLGIARSTSLRETARRLAASESPEADVLDDNGVSLGRVTLYDVVRAMTRRSSPPTKNGTGNAEAIPDAAE